MITDNSILTTPRLAMFFTVLATLSCDFLSEDEISSDKQLTLGKTLFYSVPNSDLFIDVTSLIDESFVNATLEISTPPSKGTLLKVDNVLLKYEPDSDFLAGTDDLVFSVWINGKNRHSETINIIMKSSVEELPCGLYAIDDNVNAVMGFSQVVPVLENDGLCGAGNSALKVSVHSAPTHGEASVDGNVITYTPGPTFTGTDELIYKLSAWSGDSVSYAAVTFGQCVMTAVADTINLTDGKTSVKILNNDGLCGIRKSGLEVSISSGPEFGTATFVGDSVIVYSAGPEFRGRDQLTYQLSIGTDGEAVHATVLIVADWTIESFELPGSGYSLFFLDEMTGFLAGQGIWKTTNGGKTWTEAQPELHGRSYSVQFLNNQLGYASYVDCDGNDSNGCVKWSCGLLKTSDGGESWDLISTFNADFSSHFFTSPTTGYVSVLADRDTPQQKAILYKTEDGGEHWAEVFSKATMAYYDINRPPLAALFFRVVFASSNVGYLWGEGEIYFTEDAGKSWQRTAAGSFVSSIAVTDNFAFSSRSPGAKLASPSYIVRSTYGGTWQPVVNFEHNSFLLGFSQTGNLGVTVGPSDTDYFTGGDPKSLTISRTLDQGESWTMFKIETKGQFYPLLFDSVCVPTDRVAYITCGGKLIKYSYKGG
jgi:hypothetical protein